MGFSFSPVAEFLANTFVTEFKTVGSWTVGEFWKDFGAESVTYLLKSHAKNVAPGGGNSNGLRGLNACVGDTGFWNIAREIQNFLVRGLKSSLLGPMA